MIFFEDILSRLTGGVGPREPLPDDARADIIEEYLSRLTSGGTNDETRARLRAELSRVIPKGVSLLELSLLGIRSGLQEVEKIAEHLPKAVVSAARLSEEPGLIFRLGEVSAQIIAIANLAEISMKDLDGVTRCIAGTCADPHPEMHGTLQKGGDA